LGWEEDEQIARGCKPKEKSPSRRKAICWNARRRGSRIEIYAVAIVGEGEEEVVREEEKYMGGNGGIA
jgi:hypothetical protein